MGVYKNNLFKNRMAFGIFLMICLSGWVSSAAAACLVCKPVGGGAEFEYQGSYCPSYTTFVRYCVTTPPIPTGLQVNPSPSPDGSFTVSWNTSSGATTYNLLEQVGSTWTSRQNSSSTSMGFSGRSQGTYYFSVKACNASNACSNQSSTVSVSVVYPPTINVPTSDTDGTFAVSWSNVGGSFRVLEEKSAGGSWEEIYSGTSGSQTLTRANNQYSYRVKGCTTYGDSTTGTTYTDCPTISAAKTITVNVPLPSVPAGINAPTSDDNGAYSVTWNSVSNVPAVTYTVEEKNLGTSALKVTENLTSTSLSVSGNLNYRYQYRVRACSWLSGCSAYSATDITDVAFKPGLPSFNTLPTTHTSSSLSVGFGAATGSVTWYDLNKNKIGESTWSDVSQPTTVTAQTASGLSVGDWRFQIRACKTVGSFTNCSNYATSSTVQVRPSVPGSFTVSDGSTVNDGVIALSWTAPTFATSYKIEQTVGGTTNTFTTTSTSWSSSALADGTYSFRVQGCVGSVCGTFTSSKSFSVIRQPAAPNISSISDGSASLDGIFDVVWPSQTWADSYTITQTGAASATYTLNSTATGNLSKSISLTQSGTYTFKVRACNEGVCGAYGVSQSIDVVLKPGVPGFNSLPATHTSSSLSVGFTGAGGEVVYYDLDKKLTSSSTWTGVSEPTTVASQPVTALTVGDWHFQIRACNKVNTTSNCSNFITSTTVQVRPGVPGSFVVSDGTTSNDGVVNLTWTAPGFATSYEIVQTIGSTNNTSTTTSTSWSSSALADGTYSFKVRGCVASACGSYSATKSFTVIRKPNAPAVSSISDGTTSNDGAFNVYWPSQTWANNYKISQSGAATAQYTLATTGTGTLSIGVDGLQNGQYTFSVSACNGNVCSAYGTPKSINVVLQQPSEVITATPEQPVLADWTSHVSQTEMDATDQVQTIPGSFDVSELGAATYTIPVKVADGTAGTTPQLSLQYNSQAENGLLGFGWSLTGVDSIARCKKSLLKDAEARSLGYLSSSPFCYRGQRLIAVEGSYGASGTVYKTEIDSFIKVTSYGGHSGRPDYFTLESKDGSVSTFGEPGTSNSENTGFDSSGNATDYTLGWSISEYRDSVGNRITYSWLKSRDQHAIDTIEYAFGNGATANASIRFAYEERIDPLRGYVGGLEYRNMERISHIDTYNGSDLLRSYHLGYQIKNDKSFLNTVEECVDTDGTECLEPTTFTWSYDTTFAQAYEGYQDFQLFLEDENAQILDYRVLDIDGDGRLDKFWIEKRSDANYIRQHVTGYDEIRTISVTVRNSGFKILVLDVNGDGRQDILFRDTPFMAWSLFQSRPLIYNGKLEWQLIFYPGHINLFAAGLQSVENIVVADINSDGLADIIDLESTPGKLRVYEAQARAGAEVHSLQPYTFAPAVEYDFAGAAQPLDSNKVSVADFNADGLMDIAIQVNNCSSGCTSDVIQVFHAQRDQLAFDLARIPYSGTDLKEMRTPDINGDGLIDFAYLVGNQWRYKLNTGPATTPEAFVHDSTAYGSYNLRDEEASFVDVNLDGNQDMVWTDGQIYYKPWSAREQRFLDKRPFGSFANENQRHVHIDINGNGFINTFQVVLYKGYSRNPGFNVNQLYSTYAATPRRIEKITAGLGAVTEITYKNLAGDTSEYYTHSANVLDPATTTAEAECPYGEYNWSYINGWKSCGTPSASSLTGRFYADIKQPFAYLPAGSQTLLSENIAPVMELHGAFTVVTRVDSSAPVPGNNASKVSVGYHYTKGRIQAGGRGLLGFEKLRTTDLQTGVETETTYRNDWPFLGFPIETVTRTAEGNILKRAMLDSRIVGYDAGFAATMESSGSTALGPLQLYNHKTEETKYALNNPAVVTSTIVTETTPDGDGNVVDMEVRTWAGSSTGTAAQVVNTHNDYLETEKGSRLGRLTRSTVTTSRPAMQNAEGGTITPVTRVSNFSYYGMGDNTCPGSPDLEGLLCSETISGSLTKKYFYDEFGNIAFTFTEDTASGEHGRLSTLTQYDQQGRYATASYGVFNVGTGSSSSGIHSEYLSYIDELKTAWSGVSNVNVVQTSQVISRNKYGYPEETRSYTGTNWITSTAKYTPFGSLVFSASEEGSYKVTTSSKDDLTNCPGNAVFSTSEKASGASGVLKKTCFDVLGREVRSLTVGFYDDWIARDVEHDVLSREKRISEPYFIGTETPVWTVHENYDLLGRVTLTTLPVFQTYANGSETSTLAQLTVEYLDDQATVRTSRTANVGEADLVKEDVRNVLGETVTVNEWDDGSKITTRYFYDALGNLETLVDPADNTTRMTYNALGQKIAMDDPDKGQWSYFYNSFGELVCQKDSNPQNANAQAGEGQVTVMQHDFAGRMLRRFDYDNGTCGDLDSGDLITTATWLYDNAANGLGKLVQESDSSGYAKTVQLDGFGRPTVVATTLPGDTLQPTATHYEKTLYDEHGRIELTFDAARNGSNFSHSGVLNVYNNHGYLWKQENANINAPLGQQTYYEVLEMDARGNVTSALIADGKTQTNTYFDKRSGLMRWVRTNNGLFEFQSMEMRWDTLGNLAYREDLGEDGLGVARNQKEVFEYDDRNRLISYIVDEDEATRISVDYNAIGNIESKSDVGSYAYTGAGPHAVSKAGNDDYHYDNNGNLKWDDTGRALTWSTFDKVTEITKGANETEFFYGTGRSRYKRIDTNTSTGTKVVTLYLGSVEKVYNSDDTVQWKRTLGGTIHITQKYNASGNLLANDTRYFHRDHLGSINFITDVNGNVDERMAFDPWGARRDPDNWRERNSQALQTIASDFFVALKPVTTRGYTGHEMVDEMGIIHMNGRIYDPRLARFVQADPYIQDPTVTASLNRYAYLLNNPLNATDPTGHFVFTLVAAIALKAAEATALTAFFSMWAAGYIDALAAGMRGSDAMIAGYLAGVSSVAFTGIGDTFRNISAQNIANKVPGLVTFGGLELTKSQVAAQIFSHAMVGGITSELRGGEFGHGFASAFITKATTDLQLKAAGDLSSVSDYASGAIVAAVIGGTSSAASGGKFRNGAATGAMQFLFNQAGSAKKQSEHVYKNPESLIGKSAVKEPFGDNKTGCVDLLKVEFADQGIPATKDWVEGRKIVKGLDVTPGTAIATFVDGKYPNQSTGNHAAIYLSQDKEGIWIIDQWDAPMSSVENQIVVPPPGIHVNNGSYSGNPYDSYIGKRHLKWDYTDGGASNNGSAFSTIKW